MDARQAAQFGNVSRLQQLLDSGECTPDTLDADDCSLLHWAAINNRLIIYFSVELSLLMHISF